MPLPLHIPTHFVLPEAAGDQLSFKDGTPVSAFLTGSLSLCLFKKGSLHDCIVTYKQGNSLTLRATGCEIVHEVAKEIVKLHRRKK